MDVSSRSPSCSSDRPRLDRRPEPRPRDRGDRILQLGAVGRIVRGQTISLKEKEYVEAARSLGAGDLRIMFVDIFPNLFAPVLVYLTLLIPSSIVFEARSRFSGSACAADGDLGNMLAESLGFYQVAWWFVLFPAAALLLTTLASTCSVTRARRTGPARRAPLRH